MQKLKASMLKSDFVEAGGTKTESIKVYYEVDFLFDDVDLPFVAIYFGRDEVKAKKLYHGVLSLTDEKRKIEGMGAAMGVWVTRKPY